MENLFLLVYIYDGFFRRTKQNVVRLLRWFAVGCAAITGAFFGVAVLSDETPHLLLISGVVGLCVFVVVALVCAALVGREAAK
jgi:drug/metabolite transporter superfamily protein YnfA